MTDAELTALDRAVSRFPYWLARWRRHAMTSAELHEIVPQIVAEYRRIIAKELPHGRDPADNPAGEPS